MVWQTSQAVKIPVVGVGGIMNAVDALEFMMVGATAVQVGTANFVNPGQHHGDHRRHQAMDGRRRA
jgi:dihydroorotate dehydrogenase (NAD+) catalytic subunit